MLYLSRSFKNIYIFKTKAKNILKVTVMYSLVLRCLETRVNTTVTHLTRHGRRGRPKIGVVKAGFSHPEINT